MRHCRDTFLHLLADNLGSLKVHNVRFSKDNRDANALQMNAVNVMFIDPDNSVAQESTYLASIDVVADDELTALDMADAVTRMLLSNDKTQKFNYAVTPAVPITNSFISWNADINFTTVVEEPYFHMTALVTIKHVF